MKTALKIFLLVATFSITSCSVSTGSSSKSSSRSSTKRIPPGQAKKMSGDKSAKNHAPGRN